VTIGGHLRGDEPAFTAPVAASSSCANILEAAGSSSARFEFSDLDLI
jgi:hypothetical protein